MRISDWSRRVLFRSGQRARRRGDGDAATRDARQRRRPDRGRHRGDDLLIDGDLIGLAVLRSRGDVPLEIGDALGCGEVPRSEEHTSELQSLMRISYAVFCLKKKTTWTTIYDSDGNNLPARN